MGGRLWGWASLFMRLSWATWSGIIYRRLWELDEGGCGDGASLFMGAQLGNLEWAQVPATLRAGWRGLWRWSISLWRGFVEGASGGAPSLETLEYMLRKSPDTGISLHGGPFHPRGTWNVGWGRKPGTLKDEWRRSLVVGHLSARGSMKGTLREGSIAGERERWGFWEICKMPCKRVSVSIQALSGRGTWRGFVCLGFWERKKVCLGSFLGPGSH